MSDLENRIPIGVFDSGLGGLSVLRKCMMLMPYENFIYYGDSLHAPYGTKTLQEVRERSFVVVEELLSMGCKGIVVACNTATSAAVRLMRERYVDLPLVGIEPAIKPAALHHPGSMVLVMATPMTLKEEKFQRLKGQFTKVAQIEDVPCGGLMEYIEQGILSGPELEHFLMEKLAAYPMERVGAIVLGCTHYPFIQETLQKLAGERVDIIDGSAGTAREIRRRLDEAGRLCTDKTYGHLVLHNSAAEGVVRATHTGQELIVEDVPDDPYLQRSVGLLSLPW
jgi:glutamate racemase